MSNNGLAEENVEELLPVPVDFTGDGELFMLRVRGDSMIELGILDGDFVVASQIANPNNGDGGVQGDRHPELTGVGRHAGDARADEPGAVRRRRRQNPVQR